MIIHITTFHVSIQKHLNRTQTNIVMECDCQETDSGLKKQYLCIRVCRNGLEIKKMPLSTKLKLHEPTAIHIRILRCETWTVYRHHLGQLEAFHWRCLHRLSMRNCKVKVSNVDIKQRTASTCYEANTVRTCQGQGHQCWHKTTHCVHMLWG